MVDWDKHYATRAGRMAASEIRELLKLLDQPDVISFAGGIPDPELFPRAAIAAAYRRILGDPVRGAAALQYSASEGYLPLREWIAGYMAGLGIACDADHVVITSGAQQALDFIAKLFVSPGDTVLVARPTYLGALQALSGYEPVYGTLPQRGDNRPARPTGRGGRGGWPRRRRGCRRRPRGHAPGPACSSGSPCPPRSTPPGCCSAPSPRRASRSCRAAPSMPTARAPTPCASISRSPTRRGSRTASRASAHCCGATEARSASSGAAFRWSWRKPPPPPRLSRRSARGRSADARHARESAAASAPPR